MDSLWNQAHWDSFMPVTAIYMPWDNQPVQEQTQSQPQPQPPSQPQLQPQLQLHAVLPLGVKQNKARKYTAEDWEAQKPEITRLYENKTLKSVMDFMREQHGLGAT
jgi:hypothetical protein